MPRLSKQPLLLTTLNLDELNDVLRRIQDELDRLAGLRGTVVVFDSEQYEDPNREILHVWGVKP